MEFHYRTWDQIGESREAAAVWLKTVQQGRTWWNLHPAVCGRLWGKRERIIVIQSALPEASSFIIWRKLLSEPLTVQLFQVQTSVFFNPHWAVMRLCVQIWTWSRLTRRPHSLSVWCKAGETSLFLFLCFIITAGSCKWHLHDWRASHLQCDDLNLSIRSVTSAICWILIITQ